MLKWSCSECGYPDPELISVSREKRTYQDSEGNFTCLIKKYKCQKCGKVDIVYSVKSLDNEGN